MHSKIILMGIMMGRNLQVYSNVQLQCNYIFNAETTLAEDDEVLLQAQVKF